MHVHDEHKFTTFIFYDVYFCHSNKIGLTYSQHCHYRLLQLCLIFLQLNVWNSSRNSSIGQVVNHNYIDGSTLIQSLGIQQEQNERENSNTSLTLKSLDLVTVPLPPPGVHDPEPAEDDEGEQASQEHPGSPGITHIAREAPPQAGQMPVAYKD